MPTSRKDPPSKPPRVDSREDAPSPDPPEIAVSPEIAVDPPAEAPALKTEDAPARNRGKKRITIKSVAEQAGVSIATVSFVLNNRPGQAISAPVRKRVLETAKRLNYAPSAAAAGLARKQTTNVAIFFYRNEHLIRNQLYSFVIQGAIKEATTREYNVIFSFIHEEYSDYDHLPKVVREKNAEGALFIQTACEKMIRELQSRDICTVAVDSHPAIEGLEAIYADNDLGARLACRHLAGLGHRHIAFFDACADRPSIAERRHAFLDEMKALGLYQEGGALPFIETDELSSSSGCRTGLVALAERPELTAIACGNDELASGLLQAAAQLGRRVPEDLSVLGFDDIAMASCLTPPLSTVHYDAETMGRQAMGRLIDLIEAKGSETPTVREPLVRLPVRIVERGTTGRAPCQ